MICAIFWIRGEEYFDKYANSIQSGIGVSVKILENKWIIDLKIIGQVIIFVAHSFPFSFLVFPPLPFFISDFSISI